MKNVKIRGFDCQAADMMGQGNEVIRIRGARTHNLKNIDLDIVHNPQIQANNFGNTTLVSGSLNSILVIALLRKQTVAISLMQ